MEQRKKVTLYIEDGYVKEVEGDVVTTPEVVGTINKVSVESKEKSIAYGCPAYIVIGTTKYRI